MLASILLLSLSLYSCGVSTKKEVPIVSKLADVQLIGWDNASVAVDANIVTYAGKPFLKKSLRDLIAERAVEDYCKWKGGTAPFCRSRQLWESDLLRIGELLRLPLEMFSLLVEHSNSRLAS